MSLFRRKTSNEPEPERCPMCTERVPDGAQQCAMCGADLRTLLPRERSRSGSAPTRA